eukprot:766696-Hanusia_phi.AAC.1
MIRYIARLVSSFQNDLALERDRASGLRTAAVSGNPRSWCKSLAPRPAFPEFYTHATLQNTIALAGYLYSCTIVLSSRVLGGSNLPAPSSSPSAPSPTPTKKRHLPASFCSS